MTTICRRCHLAKVDVHLPYAKISLCSNCFKEFYVKKIKRTVKEFNMFKENDTIGVAISGGKDSAALLHSLQQAFPKLKLFALHINLNISGYSEYCQAKVEELIKLLNIESFIFDLKKELGISLEDFKQTKFRRKICSICGTLKRHVLEEIANKAKIKILATGHNLDDILGYMFNNFFSENGINL